MHPQRAHAARLAARVRPRPAVRQPPLPKSPSAAAVREARDQIEELIEEDLPLEVQQTMVN